MLREEAIEVLKDWDGYFIGHSSDDVNEALNMAIKALEQEPITRNCFGCKYAKDNHNAGTEECHLCMWENQYTPITKNDIPDCQCTDAEIAKSFLEDVEAVKDQLPTTKNDLAVDCISRKAVIDELKRYFHDEYYQRTSIQDCRDCFIGDVLNHLPSVTPQEPRCKECKWWKDSDGEYRRGCGAESQCPINRREVFEGNGYCFLFEPQESEEV